MTFSDVHKGPNGTMAIVVRENKFSLEAETRFIATHYEKVSSAVRPKDFYGETEEIALAKAKAYDKRRKELHAKWRSNQKQRNQEHAA